MIKVTVAKNRNSFSAQFTRVCLDLVASVGTSTYGVMSCYELLFSSDVHWRYVRACYVINLSLTY